MTSTINPCANFEVDFDWFLPFLRKLFLGKLIKTSVYKRQHQLANHICVSLARYPTMEVRATELLFTRGIAHDKEGNLFALRKLRITVVSFRFEEKIYASKKAVDLLSATKKLPDSIGCRLTYRLLLLAFFLFHFLYPAIVFAVEQENVSFYVVCMLISFLGLLTQLFGLRKLWIDIKKIFKYCGPCKCREENLDEENCCNRESKCTSGPCGSIFNEFVTSFIGEFLIYPSMICKLIRFINSRSWEFNNALDGFGTILMGISVATDLVFAKWQYVIQATRAICATYKKYDDSQGSHLSCDNRLCTPPSYLPIYCFLLSVMHLGMLGSISFRIYADNFYGEPTNTTAVINGTLENITIYVAPEAGSYRLVGYTVYMIIAGAIIPLWSIVAYLYLNQYWFLQLLYVIRSKEEGGAVNQQRAQRIEQIPSREKCLSLLSDPLSYVIALPLMAMMVFFVIGASGSGYDNLDEALPAKLVSASLIFTFTGYGAFIIANFHTVILTVMVWYFPCTCYLCAIY